MRILSVDVGTTNVKAAVVSETLSVARQVNVSLPSESPGPGLHEHSPKALRGAMLRAMRAAVRGAGGVDAIALTSYLFGVMAIDKRGTPLTNMVTWLDERALAVLGKVEGVAAELYLRTGCPPTHVYALPKIIWFRERARDVFEKAAAFLDSKAFTVSVLAGELITDLATASGTYQMLNIRELRWDPLALELAGVDEGRLPELSEGDAVLRMRPSTAREVGLPEPVDVVLGVYDGASMMVGLALFDENVAVVNLGTSAMLRTVISEPVVDSSELMRFQTYYLLRGRWLSGGAVNNAGNIIEWVLKTLFPDYLTEPDPYGKLMETASRAESGGLVFVPLLTAERLPFIDPSKRGVLTGLSFGTGREAIARASVEGIVMLLKVIDEALRDNGISYREVRVGGKLSRYPFVARVLANVLGSRVVTAPIADATHVGNAIVALRALRAASLRELRERARVGEAVVEPSAELRAVYASKYEEFKKVLAAWCVREPPSLGASGRPRSPRPPRRA